MREGWTYKKLGEVCEVYRTLYKEQLQVGGVIQRSLVEFCKFVNKGKKK